MLLHCETRPYAWGKKGLNSEVGKLVKYVLMLYFLDIFAALDESSH
jgi:hypothetical protein